MKLRTPVKFGLRLLQQRLGVHRPLFASFFVTDRCNVRCDGCVYYDNIDDNLVRQREETAPALKILDALAAEGIPIVSYVGGEPFLRKDLAKLLREGQRRGFSQSVITNAMIENPEAVRAAEETCDEVVFSPHPPSELSGKDPVEKWERAWTGLASLRTSLRRPSLVCAMIISKHTVPLLDEMIHRALDAGVDRIRYQPNFFPSQFPSPEAVREAAETIRQWTTRHPKRFIVPRAFIDEIPSFFGTAPRVACTAERRFNLGVYLDGTVSACCPAYVPIGNLFETPISQMLGGPVERKPDCYGCHRSDVLRTMGMLGERV